VASAAAGMTIALAATGIGADGAATPEAAGASMSLTSAQSASYTTASGSRAAYVKSRNPRGHSYVHRSGTRAHFHGRVTDPDNTHSRLAVTLFRNGHKVETVKTTKGTHHYGIRTHLSYGTNTFVVVAKNIGVGQPHAKLRTAKMHRKWTWGAHYHGAKHIAATMFKDFGWGKGQMQSLVNLWNRESGWSTTAANASGAYGIPQALPGSKMSSAGPNWQHNARTQIRWGLGYIADRYGSPNNAWGHSQATGWY
jgi:hypothetical protein